jgi:antitoxin ParD1/3/4
MDAFVSAQLSESEYVDFNALFEAALQLLKTDAEEIEAIRAAIIEGEESGEPREFDFEAFLQRKRAARENR